MGNDDNERSSGGVDSRNWSAALAPVASVIVALIVTVLGAKLSHDSIMEQVDVDVTFRFCELAVNTLCNPEAGEEALGWAADILEKQCEAEHITRRMISAVAADRAKFELLASEEDPELAELWVLDTRVSLHSANYETVRINNTHLLTLRLRDLKERLEELDRELLPRTELTPAPAIPVPTYAIAP